MNIFLVALVVFAYLTGVFFTGRWWAHGFLAMWQSGYVLDMHEAKAYQIFWAVVDAYFLALLFWLPSMILLGIGLSGIWFGNTFLSPGRLRANMLIRYTADDRQRAKKV